MREHIDTIPVWDAYRDGGECPLCALRAKNEAMYVENFLGASVMEPSHRVEVNRKGFCARHFRMLFDAGNRLGLALLLDTYMKETLTALSENARAASEMAAAEASKPLIKRLGGKKAANLADCAGAAEEIAGKCVLCERLDATMERYAYTVVYLWKHESEFRQAFSASKGVCVGHYAELLRQAGAQLSGRELADFVLELARLQSENMNRVEKELEWFTLKFDYRNKDKPWGNSQDAVERAIGKLRGNF